MQLPYAFKAYIFRITNDLITLVTFLQDSGHAVLDSFNTNAKYLKLEILPNCLPSTLASYTISFSPPNSTTLQPLSSLPGTPKALVMPSFVLSPIHLFRSSRMRNLYLFPMLSILVHVVLHHLLHWSRTPPPHKL